MRLLSKKQLLIIMTSLTMVSPAGAAQPDSKAEIDNLKKRIEALETGQEAESAEEKPFSLFAPGKYLELSGLLEVEGVYTNTKDDDDSSELNLATFEFSAEVTINDYIGGHVTLLYEEDDPDDNSLKVDEAVISLNCPKPFLGQTPAFYGGRMYVPFGKFNTNMISDPLTQELGESNDTAALIALEGDLWNLSLGTFNGATDKEGDNDSIDTFVASLEITPVENISFGFSYINDLAESNAELIEDEMVNSDSVGGASAFISAVLGQFGLEAEILGALDDFDSNVVGRSDLSGKKPLAWYTEVSWQAADKLQFVGRYEQARDFQDDLTRYGASCSYGLFSNTVIAFEYLRSEPDSCPASNTLTMQLALEF